MITTWCCVSAIRRPSASLAASTESPHEIVSLAGTTARFACSQEARSAELPRSYVEMIMNAKSPASGEQTGLAEAPVGLVQGMSVMSNVRSRPGGLVLPWDLSWYFQVPG